MANELSVTSTEVEAPNSGGLTELISRLANEFYSGADRGIAQQSLPPVAALPQKSGASTANGSFMPPVHPTTIEPLSHHPAQPEIAALDPGSDDTYAFGNPHRYFDREDLAQHNRKKSQQKPVQGSEVLPAGTEYYFLQRPAAQSGVVSNAGNPAQSIQPLDVDTVRRDFPALHQKVNGHQLVWLDNAATTHKPQRVIDATSQFYGRDNSNIHRAAHTLAARSTELFEESREKVRRFLGAADAKEIVFLRGTTEAINLVAQSYGRSKIGPGDEILLTTLEHHANIVPWQLLAGQVGAVIRVVPVNDSGELMLDQFATLLNSRTKLVAVTHVSNALGTVTPVEQIIALAHAYGVPVLVDGAQSAPHMPLNVQALNCDFFTISGHKVFGPTGIGVLYGKASLLEEMPPWQGGGHMIRDVTFAKTSFQNAPEKFEAGTPDIAGVVGLGAAVDYLMTVGMPVIAAYEHGLLEYATRALATVPGIRPIGTAANKASVLSFVIDGIPSEQIGRHLDKYGIAVRSGHHCAQPAVRRFGLEGTVRPSLAFYNTHKEVDLLVEALHRLKRTKS